MIRSACLLLIALSALNQSALAADPHALFESRCGRCHEHAGSLVRETLELDQGVVRGARSGRDMAAFLPRHRGALTPAETAVLLDMFRRQLLWGGVFQARCRICHDSARALALDRLVLREGALYGRYSGREIGAFLAFHGRATAPERQDLLAALRWQLEAAGRAR